MKSNKNDIKDHLRSLSKINDAAKDLNIEEAGKNNKRKDLAELKETLRRLKIQNGQLQEQLSIFKKKLKQVNAEQSNDKQKMNKVKELENQLSQALGSCPECWGSDPGCPDCSGNGISGWRKINKRLFNIHVLPALEKLYGLSKKLK